MDLLSAALPPDRILFYPKPSRKQIVTLASVHILYQVRYTGTCWHIGEEEITVMDGQIS